MRILKKCWWTRKHDYQWPNQPMRHLDELRCIKCGRSGGLKFYVFEGENK